MSGYRGPRGGGGGGGGGGGDNSYGPSRRAGGSSWRGGGGGGQGGPGGRPHPYAREPRDGPGPAADESSYGPSGRGRGGRGGRGGRRGPYPDQRDGGGKYPSDRAYRGPPLPSPAAPLAPRKDDRIDRTKEPMDESIVIYTWPDASLRELAELIQLVNEDARKPETEISFAFVYPDRTGTNVLKHVQSIPALRKRAPKGRGASFVDHADRKTLKELKFETGDFLDVALFDKRAPPPAAAAAAAASN